MTHYREVDPLSAEYQRPEPWVGYVARLHEPDGTGFHDPTGISADVVVTDQWTFANKPLSHLDLFRLACDRIRGAGAHFTGDHRLLPEEAATFNSRLAKGYDFSHPDFHYGVIISGATPLQIHEAIGDIMAESERTS